MQVRIASEHLFNIRKHLRAAEPREEGGFAVVGAVLLPDGRYALTVRGLVLPDAGDWLDQGDHWLSPTTAYINRCVMRADAMGGGLLAFHSHPDPRHPAALSPIDERSTQMLFANLQMLLPGMPLASLVFTSDQVAGVARIHGRDQSVTSLRELGTRIIDHEAADLPRKHHFRAPEYHDMHQRQELALGPETQNLLRSLHVAVVGAGGTGSAVLEQLARLGVGRVTIVDDDIVEASNVSRIFGSTLRDVGRQKVAVAAELYRGIAPTAHVEPVHASVADPAVQRALCGADFVFGCTDTDSSRATLNDLAYQEFVPVLDTGCRLVVRGGAVEGQLGRVRYLSPGLPCLWCTDTINGTKILQETMSDEERARLAASGYGSLTGPQPMVVHLTSTVAALAISEFLKIAVGFGAKPNGDYLLLDLQVPRIDRVSSDILKDCRCQRTYGRGHVLAEGGSR